jgi:hypothetical protein
MGDTSTYLAEAFNADEEEGSSYDLMPNGKYIAEVTEATVKETRAGTGSLVNLKWTVTEGDCAKRVLFQSILVRHENADAQRIGKQKMKDLCIACSVTGAVTDLNVFLNKPCLITVGTETDESGQYPDKNRVNRIMPVPAAPRPKVTKLAQPVNTPTPKEDVELNDSIPF